MRRLLHEGDSPMTDKTRCGDTNPWCECCYCERKPGHGGKHRVTYSKDRIARWDADDTARIAADADEEFLVRIRPYTLRYHVLMDTGRKVRTGEAVASKTDEHRLHGGLIMLHGLIVDAIAAFRSRETRMDDDELRRTLGLRFGDYGDHLLDVAELVTGVPVWTLMDWYGITGPDTKPARPTKVRVGKKRLKF